MRKIELKLDKNKKGCGLFGLSLVEKPAFQQNFTLLSEDNRQPIFFFSEDEKQIASGPLMIPNVMVYRNGKSMKDNEEAYIYFSEETIRECASLYMSGQHTNNITLEHQENVKNDNITLLELWLIADPLCDKSKTLGFELPSGTLMCSVQFNDVNLWNEAKTGKFNGFSLEGLFDFNDSDITTLSHHDTQSDIIQKIMQIIKSEISE